MESVPKIRELSIDEDINEQSFISMLDNLYKREVIIYIIIPEWEDDLLDELSDDLVIVNKITFPLTLCLPRSYGYVGYIKNNSKRYIYELYKRSDTLDHLLLSEIDLIEKLSEITKKNIDNFFRVFELNKIPHITIGPDAQWVNIIEY
ncbi:hypothetical protein [Guptibacillus hwajinpoensis]|uniref:hypothetical protein n=1 Tax=Guptibacillus hwajinpoensis TaxID=208199 RepID=UPI0024B3525F|nr:hypothetical protein [Pseudalkalibacillus hwajinpoensis]